VNDSNICSKCGEHANSHSNSDYCPTGENSFSNHQKFSPLDELELARLKEENARLRKALEPFAREADYPDKRNTTLRNQAHELNCRAAKKALEGE
jgi:hypothetical protein